MPNWINVLLQMLPTVIAEITALIQAIQQGGGTPTPAQAVQLASLWSVHNSIVTALSPHMNVNANA